MIQKGGRRNIFLGTRECQGYVEPCDFDSESGFYEGIPELSFGLMYHGFTYPDEARIPEPQGKMAANFWYPVMKRGGYRRLSPPGGVPPAQTPRGRWR